MILFAIEKLTSTMGQQSEAPFLVLLFCSLMLFTKIVYSSQWWRIQGNEPKTRTSKGRGGKARIQKKETKKMQKQFKCQNYTLLEKTYKPRIVLKKWVYR